MKTTALSASNKLLWDPIRRLHVKATQEEKVRQALLQKMLSDLAFPKALIAVEKELESFSRPPQGKVPKRRVDLLVYIQREEELKPLLLVECKAALQLMPALMQAFGYNEILQAPFLAFAWGEGVKTFWKDKGEIHSVPFLPTYGELCRFYK